MGVVEARRATALGDQGSGGSAREGGRGFQDAKGQVSLLNLKGRGGFVVEVEGARVWKELKCPLGLLESSRRDSFSRR